uniref:Major facilitator superfamily (MFS) profile domain-containing protein n=1 Tax=Moniliophthora roreri TaxID=221103 RepID=A0A0W0G0X2_MONRR
MSSTTSPTKESKEDIASDSSGVQSLKYAIHDPAAEKRAVRRMDWAVLPLMTMYYLLSFLDRANIGNARVAGLQKALHMTDHQYQIVVTVLYVPYICAELPANLLLRKIGPRIMMPILLTTWGIIVTLQGVVTSYAGLTAVRAVLGLVEGPMFPGIVLYLSGFYTRRELSMRIAVFFSSASLSGAFSGLLAAAIVKMDGIGGKPGWAWIFILEGLFSVIIGVIGFFCTPSTPRDVKFFMTDEDKDIVERRLIADRPSVAPNDHFSFKEVFRSLSSPHVLIVFVIFYMLGTTLYGLALFLPSIVNQLGFSPNRSQLLSVGPFAAGFLLTMVSAYWSDKNQSRALPAALISLLAVAGYAMYLKAETKFVAYGSLYLTVPGVYAGAPVIAAWMANNSEPYYRRATSVAFGFIATNAGGITSTWLFPTKEGPKFRRTTILDMVSALIVVLAVVNAVYLSRQNKLKKEKREKLLAPYITAEEPDGGQKAWMELGDRHPDFKYSY